MLGGATFRQDLLGPLERAGMRRGHERDQMRDILRVANGVGKRNHAAIRRAEQHDLVETEMVAQRFQIFDIVFEGVGRAISPARATLSAMVDVDQLHLVRERIERRLVVAMVTAGSAVQHERDRLFDHAWTIGNESGAVHVEPDLGSSNTSFQPFLLACRRG